MLKEFVRDRKTRAMFSEWRRISCVATLEGNVRSSPVTDRSRSQQRKWPGRDLGRGERLKKVLTSTQLLPGARYCDDNSMTQVLVLCQSWEVVTITVSQTGKKAGSSVTLFGSWRGSVARWTCQTPCLLIPPVLPKEWRTLCTVCVNMAVVTFWAEHRCFIVKWLQQTFYLFSTQVIDTLDPNTYQTSVTASFLLPQRLHCLKGFIFILPRFLHF